MQKNIVKSKVLFLMLCTSFSIMSVAQDQEPVKWSFAAKKISADTYEIHLTATIDRGWHTYSQATPEGGPVPTAITFSKNPLLIIL